MPHPRNPLQQLIPQRIDAVERRLAEERWTGHWTLPVYGGPLNDEPVGVEAARRQSYTEVQRGEHFGGPGDTWQQRWFRFELPAAEESEHGRRLLFWDCQGESTVFIDGVPWAGLDIAHTYCPMPDHECTVWVDTGTYQTAIWVDHPRQNIEYLGCRFDGASLSLRAHPGWDVYWDFHCLNALLHHLLAAMQWNGNRQVGYNPPVEKASVVTRRLIDELDRACDIYETESIEALGAHLAGIYETLPAAAWQGNAALCGHAHLDLVWLWPESVTKRKAVHSFATVMRLMERYPELCFTQSQPPLYDTVREQAPGLFDQINKRMQEGRWEATGGFEVECDVNLPCGEALARALKYGQQRFAKTRPDGRPSRVVWIPDVFGYAGCLPQIMKLGGIEGFFTTKMTWSSVTRFPHTSFRWRGSDGSEILTHLCPTSYNGTVDIGDVSEAMQRHRQSGVHDDLLLPTGYGDGAGGPTEEMCERARRFADLAHTPRTAWTTVEDFFDRLDTVRDRLPRFDGELYLEFHRGTYTTQAQYKWNYRKAEQALQAREAVRVAKHLPALPAQAWLRLCFAQFHDAIPGSSIGLVYEQMNPELEQIAAAQLHSASQELTAQSPASDAPNDKLSVFNPSMVPRTVLVELTDQELHDLSEKTKARAQAVHGADDGAHLVSLLLPPLSNIAVDAAAAEPNKHAWETSARVLDNGIVRAEFSDAGQLHALTVRGTPVHLAEPAAFRLYPDNPAAFDAWDIDRYSLALGTPCRANSSPTILESGPLRAIIAQEIAVGEKSTMQVRHILEADSSLLHIELDVDWREDHKLLKFHLPTRHCGRMARYGAPFGSVERPQHAGLPSDESQWEVPGSRWAAVLDDNGKHGAAIITEAKYGFSCRDGDLGLSLLRAPKHPDPNADRGAHRIRFAVGLHREETADDGSLSTAVAADTTYSPVLKTCGAACGSPFTLSELGSLAPAWTCPAESCDGTIIRLHETAGGRGTAYLHLAEGTERIDRVDFLENRLETLSADTSRPVAVPYNPYEIVSLRVSKAP